MKKFWTEFKKFISRGNVIDMAVGVIIASAFSAIVTALTNQIIMPIINWLLSLGGENGLESAYTFLRKVYDTEGAVDLTNSIYIDWGTFITAIINFFLIALVLFFILKAFNKSKELAQANAAKRPTKEQKKILKERGVDLKDRKAVAAGLETLKAEEKAKKEAEALKNKVITEKELLTEIRDLLKAQAPEGSKSESTSEGKKD